MVSFPSPWLPDVSIRLLSGTALADRLPALTCYAQRGRIAPPSHDPIWLNILKEGLGHVPFALEAEHHGNTVGWLPLAYIRSTLFGRYSFTGTANYLGLSTEPKLDENPDAMPQRSRPRLWQPDWMTTSVAPVEATGPRTPVSIVVPCYNEELILPYLANTLKSVEQQLSKKYAPTFILVDDGSKDNTWEGMQKTFGGKPGFELYRHAANRGVAAAILTGIRRARSEIVCSMDCDCTYDPHELANMIPLLKDDVDLVTASPYHPEGTVRNVPGWRLKLSKSASWLYRRVLRQKLYTYTSCFRVYRRSAFADLEIKKPGYLGIAEMLGRLDLQGSKIVEYPATLEVRMIGRSKMKTLRTIVGHLRLMTRLFGVRLHHWWTQTPDVHTVETCSPTTAADSEPVAAVR